MDLKPPKVPVPVMKLCEEVRAPQPHPAAAAERVLRPTNARPIMFGRFQESLTKAGVSPNTLQSLLNPMRSQLGLPPVRLMDLEESSLKLELPAAETESYLARTGPRADTETVPSRVDAVNSEDAAITTDESTKSSTNDPVNDELNASFLESSSTPFNFLNLSGSSDPSVMGSISMPTKINEMTRSFANAYTAGDDECLEGRGITDENRNPQINHQEQRLFGQEQIMILDDKDRMNNDSHSFVISRRKFPHEESLNFTEQFEKMSLLQVERSRCAVSPDKSHHFGSRKDFSPEFHSNRSQLDMSGLSYAEEKSELYHQPTHLEQPFSPAESKSMTFEKFVLMQKAAVDHKTESEELLPFPNSGFCGPSRPLNLNVTATKCQDANNQRQYPSLDSVANLKNGSCLLNSNASSNPARQFGRCLEKDKTEILSAVQQHQQDFTFNKPMANLKTTTPNNNTGSLPEVAARIPAGLSGTGSGGNSKMCGAARVGNGYGFGTPMPPTEGRARAAPLSSTGKHKGSKEKDKKAQPGSGWKFPSVHVEEKEYLIMKQLGKGGCGEVSMVIEKESRQFFALKKVHLAGIDDDVVKECTNEVQLLANLRDTDLVVHIFAWDFSDKTLKIIMEYGQCDLSQSIRTINTSLWKLKFVWERILTIVDTIHSRGIVHSDLKPANFIWVGGNLKIIDFGIASRIQQDHTSIATLCPKGTLNYISPETIQLDAYGTAKMGPKSDIWSLGCIFYLMVYGKSPFEHITNLAVKATAITRAEISYPTLPSHLKSSSLEIRAILEACFQLDYRHRPTTFDLLLHRFLKP